MVKHILIPMKVEIKNILMKDKEVDKIQLESLKHLEIQQDLPLVKHELIILLLRKL